MPFFLWCARNSNCFGCRDCVEPDLTLAEECPLKRRQSSLAFPSANSAIICTGNEISAQRFRSILRLGAMLIRMRRIYVCMPRAMTARGPTTMHIGGYFVLARRLRLPPCEPRVFVSRGELQNLKARIWV